MSLYFIPLIAAFIGWFANWLTIKLLFRSNLLKDSSKSMLPVVETHMDIFLKEKLPEAMPVFKMFIGESTTSQVKGVFMKEVDTMLPEMINQYLGKLKLQRLFPLAGAALGFLLGLLFILLSHLSS
jgi:hypothetical protein